MHARSPRASPRPRGRIFPKAFVSSSIPSATACRRSQPTRLNCGRCLTTCWRTPSSTRRPAGTSASASRRAPGGCGSRWPTWPRDPSLGARPDLREVLPPRSRHDRRHRGHRARPLHRPRAGQAGGRADLRRAQQRPGIGLLCRDPGGGRSRNDPYGSKDGSTPLKSVANRIRTTDSRDETVGVTVLIVDDHPSFRASARTLLEAEGYDVVGEAENGETAVEAARKLQPDLVLLDVQLPGIDGFAVAGQLRKLEDPPVVILTSSRDGADYGPCIGECGAHGFVPKADLSGAAIAAFLVA